MNGATPRSGLPPRSVALRTDSRLENVELLARAVRGLAAAAGVEARACARVELAVAEAVNNVIRHAYQRRPGLPVEVVFTLDEDRFTLEVVDEGTPMEPRRAPVLDFDPGDLERLPEGGMGLFIIHSVMDQVEYRSAGGRNSLLMTRRLAA
jgi:serine/threonine-protein kinase RsbW